MQTGPGETHTIISKNIIKDQTEKGTARGGEGGLRKARGGWHRNTQV